MAEFYRRSGRRILESIDTRKANKQEVFDFYQRWRKLLKSKGGQVGKALKLGDVKKSDLIQELEKLEQIQINVRAAQKAEKTKYYTEKYEETKKEMQGSGIWGGVAKYKQFEKTLKAAASRGDIDLKTFIGGAFKDIGKKKTKEEKEKAKRKKKQQAEPEQPKRKNYEESSRSPLRKPSRSFRGRLAHDLVSKWVDDALIDTDYFDDSDAIWAAMETIEENPTDYNLFEQNYAGEERKGSQAYYEEFQYFLDIKPKFEAALLEAGEEIPPYPSVEYWNKLQAWRRSNQNSL